MAPWYQDKFRRTLLDMHIEDWDDSFLSQYDPKDYFASLKEAKINAAMIYVQSHVGLCYWPTKSGLMHKAFVGKEDQVRQLFGLCHNYGIDTVLYYSIIYNNRAYEQHPTWRMKDYTGTDSRANGGRYGLCCPNNEEYREFVRQQIAEFSEYFDYEGIFFDMTFWPEVCYCDSCKARWQGESSGEMPAVVGWRDPAWLEFDRLRHQWIGEFGQMITDEAKRWKPGISVEHQYGNSMSFWRFGNNENISLASDYIGTDLYGGILQQSFACKAWYNLTQNQPFQYMTSRCHPSLAEHTTTKSFDQLRQCVAMTYLHHGASLLIDAIDPVGTVDHSVYETMGKIYGETQQLEPYLSRGKMAYDVSLYFDLNGKYDVEANSYNVMDHALDRDAPEAGSMPHYDAQRGAAASLAKHHIPFGIINNWKPEEMRNHKVLVLADVPGMTEAQISAVKEYLESGGNIYMSGHTAPVLLQEVFGAKWEGYTDEKITYMAPVDGSDVMQGLFTRKHPLIQFEKAVKISGVRKGEVLATLTLPYTRPGIYWSMFPTDVAEKKYVSVDGPCYPFSTIHANPPGVETTYPALLKGKYGKGTVVWSAMPIERTDRYQHSHIFAGIIRMLAGDDFQFGANCPDSVECVLFNALEHKQKLMGLIETRQEAHIPATHDIQVWIKSPAKPETVYMLADGREIPYSYEDGKVQVTLEKMDIYAMFAVQY